MNIQREQIKKRNGQAMILSVMMLGGVLISIGVIAGILVLYQIRQVNDVENSAKAFFAADAGIEWRTYNMYIASTTPPTFVNGASFISTSTLVGENVFIRVQGFAGDAVRALDSEFVAPLAIKTFATIDGVYTVPQGGSTQLVWDSVNASYCMLGVNSEAPNSVSLSSAGFTVNPPGIDGNTDTYTLTCGDGEGASAVSNITITITSPE